MIEYTLIRSRRKTAALYVREGVVEVRAPLQMPKCDIERFVASKERWITDNVSKQDKMAAQREKFRLGYGAFVGYRGKQYPIEAKEGNHIGFDDKRFYVPKDLTPQQIMAACAQVYRMLAKRDLTEKAHGFAKRMSVAPCSVKINGARTRWGSCSAKKSLNFSWRLIMADDAAIDYVVVHELAHLIEMNHSARFWAIVEDVLPDYKERKKLLDALQRQLAGEGWQE